MTLVSGCPCQLWWVPVQSSSSIYPSLKSPSTGDLCLLPDSVLGLSPVKKGSACSSYSRSLGPREFWENLCCFRKATGRRRWGKDLLEEFFKLEFFNQKRGHRLCFGGEIWALSTQAKFHSKATLQDTLQQLWGFRLYRVCCGVLPKTMQDGCGSSLALLIQLDLQFATLPALGTEAVVRPWLQPQCTELTGVKAFNFKYS
jgi:hypothetical protein